MPELPEVETVANELRKAPILGVPIVAVEIFWQKIASSLIAQDFITALKGQTIVGIERRAKYLIFKLSTSKHLVVHLRMTGRILIKPTPCPPLPHEHLILTLKNGLAIHYHDTRKFGRWVLVDDASLFLKKLGPEPLSASFSKRDFKYKLSRSKRQLKPLLLDQTFIAGLGNIYVDEALWQAQLHPQLQANEITLDQAALLFEAIKLVLERGLTTRGTTLGTGKSNFYLPDGKRGNHQQTLQVFRRTGLPCPRCQSKISRLLVAQRSTHICPHCQRRVV